MILHILVECFDVHWEQRHMEAVKGAISPEDWTRGRLDSQAHRLCSLVRYTELRRERYLIMDENELRKRTCKVPSTVYIHSKCLAVTAWTWGTLSFDGRNISHA